MTLSQIQGKVNEFTSSKHMNSDISIRIIDLVSEIGELSKEVLKGTNYGRKNFKETEEWKSLISK